MTGNRTVRQLMVLVVMFIVIVGIVVFILAKLGLNLPIPLIVVLLFPLFLGFAAYIKNRIN